MKDELIIKLVTLLILIGVFGFRIAYRFRSENAKESAASDEPKYSPFIASFVLPWIIFIYPAMTLILDTPAEAFRVFLSMTFNVFLHIVLYYAILLLVLPIFRTYFSARSCALLWIIPNYLYMFQHKSVANDSPLVILEISQRILWALLIIWIIGFLIVFLGKIISHLRFRSYILKDSVPVTDSEILRLWEREMSLARVEKRVVKLVQSANVLTPMTIGLRKRTMKIVLPMKQYNAEELSLIFKHELIHIERCDSLTKLFLVFCTAICWFNPLMWIAMEKSAQDLELSCDETVLLHSNDVVKRRYAELILNTAGDERGFTTCLSAKAQSLRYRLKNIMSNRRKNNGAIIVGIIFALLVISCGYVSLAYDESTVEELVFQNDDVISSGTEIYWNDHTNPIAMNVSNQEALLKYLNELPVSRFTGNYFFDDEDYKLSLQVALKDKKIYIDFSDSIIEVWVHELDEFDNYFYYLPEGIDWNIINSYIK